MKRQICVVGLRENVYKTPASAAVPALVAIISSVTHACHQSFPFFPGFSESAEINQLCWPTSKSVLTFTLHQTIFFTL